MKSLYTFFAAIISFLAVSSVSAATPTACTMDYTPVCGAVQVQCIRAPCYPVYQTFGNMCTLKNANNVTFVKNGECGASE